MTVTNFRRFADRAAGAATRRKDAIKGLDAYVQGYVYFREYFEKRLAELDVLGARISAAAAKCASEGER